MKRVVLAARLLLGLFLLASGVGGLVLLGREGAQSVAGQWEGAARVFVDALAGSYLFTFVKLTEAACGLLLLSGFWVPLALTMLAPIVLNILAFHLSFDPRGIAPGAALLVFQLYLVYAYRSSFRELLRARSAPD